MSENLFGAAASEILPTAYHLIPLDSVRRMSRIFAEGIAAYKDKAVNSRNITPAIGNQAWQDERFSHAVEHLFKGFVGDTTEDHFAKVMWYCAVMMRVRELETKNKERFAGKAEDLKPYIKAQAVEALGQTRNIETGPDAALDTWYTRQAEKGLL